MSPENSFTRKLKTTYSGKFSSGVTPVQIEGYIKNAGKLRELSDLTGIDDIGLIKDVFHPNGKLLAHKVKGCIKSLTDLHERCGDELDGLLEHLDPKCFRNNGKINFGRLRKKPKKPMVN